MKDSEGRKHISEGLRLLQVGLPTFFSEAPLPTNMLNLSNQENSAGRFPLLYMVPRYCSQD